VTWKTAKLGEVCEVVSGATPKTGRPEFWGGDVPWVTPKDLSDLESKTLSDTPRKITKAGLDSCSARMLPAQSVLFSSRAPIGLVAINSIPVCTNQGFKSMVPSAGRISSDYLYWWLRLNRERLDKLGRGATFKEVSKKIVEEVEIPLPPLTEQKRMAGILDAADALRAKRREALVQLDTLMQSTFLDMFGDPVTNPMGWARSRIGDLGDVITGNTPARKCSEYYGDAIEWIKSDNINDPSFTLTNAEEGLSQKGRRIARIAPKGSVLVTCIAGSRSCIGNAAIADREVAFNQQINAFVPGKRVLLWYAFGIFLMGKDLVQRASTNSMKGMVSKSAFAGITIPLPPLDLQHRFAAIVESVERQKALMRAHLAELEALFASLQSRAFSGTL
jgi:type I restriction enzyme, S subunit